MRSKIYATPTAFTPLKKGLFIVAASLIPFGSLISQSMVYDDFEGKGKKYIHYGERGGVLDTMAKDPSPKDVNAAGRCALYVRNGSKNFDNIKMGLVGYLTDVDRYATYMGIPPRLKMKIYTTAPAGTLVEILLGSKRGNNDYPAGTNSQYQAYTTVSNKWEELEFKFSQVPQGSQTSFSQIDQVTLLFNPNSANSDTYYFDEITGPPVSTTKVKNEMNITEQAQPSTPQEQQTSAPAVNTTKPVSTATSSATPKSTKKTTTEKKTKKQ
jgi:hypothetical protein